MFNRRRLLWAWLALGALLMIHDAVTGGGLAGYLLYREIAGFGAIEPVLTRVGLGAVLVLVPAFCLLPPRRMRGSPGPAPRTPDTPMEKRAVMAAGGLIAALLTLVCAHAALQAQATPTSGASVVRIAIGGPGGAIHPADRDLVVLQGEPQPDQAVRYDEVTNGKHGPSIHHRRTFAPITEPGWTPDRSVRAIVEIGEDETGLMGPKSIAPFLSSDPQAPPPGVQETAPGVLTMGGVPGYLRLAFADRGVKLAPDAGLHVENIKAVHDDRMGMAILSGLFAAFALMLTATGAFVR